MKKKLEAELISIAHRILKLRNKSDVEQLYSESRQLYEKLAILRFAEQNFNGAQPTIGIREIEQQIESYAEDNANTEPVASSELVDAPAGSVADTVEAVAAEDHLALTADVADETSPESFESPAMPEGLAGDSETHTTDKDAELSPLEEETSNEENDLTAGSDKGGEHTDMNAADNADDEAPADDITQLSQDEQEHAREEAPAADEAKKTGFDVPAFELTFEKKEDLVPTDTPVRKQITFDDLLGLDYSDPVFEKVGTEAPKVEFDGAADGEKDDFTREVKSDATSATDFPKGEYKPVEAKDGPSRQISFGLNDRIGFEKHLFGGSSEDMNRVVSQLTTFDTFEEARDFIEDMVKPDYNNWEGKDDYSKRFMDIIEQRFA